MRFNKKCKRGLFLLFFLILITAGISFITFKPKNTIFDQNSVSLSAPDDPYEENDLWDKHPEIVESLINLLEKYQKQGYSRPL